MSMRAIQISRLGGPEVLIPVELPEPTPKPHQLLVNVAAAGINYADTHIAEGSYLSKPELPLVPGSEVIGRTPDGRRVMALTDGSGGYAEKAAVVGQLAVEVPETVSDGEALAVLAQGLSAWHLLRTCARLAPGETVVINAAAGGVGSLAVQLGADAAVDGSPDGYAERVIEANGGRRVDVVLEPVGGAVFDAALRTVAPFGRLVTFGQASRQAPQPVDPVRLMHRNLAVVGFWLPPALVLPGGFAPPLAELLTLVTTGRLRPIVGGEYPLDQARRAHEEMLARRTTGKLILRP